MLKWVDEFSVGHDRIDVEHQFFIRLIEDFHKAMAAPLPRQRLIRILREIHKFSVLHHYAEENIMQDHHYPDFEKHKKLHTFLLDQLKEKIWELEEGSNTEENIYEFLLDWYSLHNVNEDKKFQLFMQTPAGKSPGIGHRAE